MSAAYMRRCARKRRYEDKEEATKARAALAAGQKINAYRCDQCLGWHVGRSTGVFITRNRNGKRPNKKMRGRV